MKKDSLITTALVGIIIALITFSQEAKQGATNGIALCENIIVPALLPILIITNIIIKSRCSQIIEMLFGKITECVLKLPRCSATAILFGLIAGYPSGAILTEHLYNKGKITQAQAKRIMRFNFCGGLAFIITAVGTIHLNNTKLGLIIYLCSFSSSIIIALTGAIKSKDKPQKASYTSPILSLTDAMVESVEATTKAIITMCAYIILFSTIMSIAPIPNTINPIIEITNGLFASNIKIPIGYYAFFLTFGGLCIHFQLIGSLKNMGIGYLDFLTHRLIAGLIAFALGCAYSHFFPQADSVFSNLSQSSPAITQANAGLSIVMLLGCVVIIFDVENKKYKLI